ncbi:hypothetical protein C0991_002990 [Blastosporella zonata]|nr:hypothetical protein C0991_002990 [Blastosporella zonata]
MDANFRSLGLSSMQPIQAGSNEFRTLEAYARDTHGATHRHMQVTITNAYRVERPKTNIYLGHPKQKLGTRGSSATSMEESAFFCGMGLGPQILQ